VLEGKIYAKLEAPLEKLFSVTEDYSFSPPHHLFLTEEENRLGI
jgi:hypothetical protein